VVFFVISGFVISEFVISELSREVIVCFVNIGGIVDHHSLIFCS
jgi:peptidoglycan/LPS O-acetylase OafA/YrhL